jgi:hypothetical protein
MDSSIIFYMSSASCPNQGLSNGSIFRQFQIGDTVPLNIKYLIICCERHTQVKGLITQTK